MHYKDIIAIIPARGGSKGIPKKNIIDFCGKPLIAWSIEQALKSKYIKAVYVSTDSNIIAKVARTWGARIIQRPGRLAKDSSSSEESLLHALSVIEKENKVDLVVFLQATSPVREDFDIDRALRKFFAQGSDSLFSSVVLGDFCTWENSGGKWESVSYDYKNRKRRQERKTYYLENGSIYIFKPEILRKYNNRLGGKISSYIMDDWKGFQIDRREDIEICAHFMQNKILQSKLRLKADKIDLLVYDFDGVMTDNLATMTSDGREAVVVNRGDGLAVNILRKKGVPQIVVTSEENEFAVARARKINLPVFSGVSDKNKFLNGYCRKNKLDLHKTIYLGNDLNDLEVMKNVGFPICPADACQEIKDISRLVLDVCGGQGVIRNFLTYIDF